MSESLEFGGGNSNFNDSVFGALRDWVRTKHGIGVEATYHDDGRPKEPDFFFAVLWQIKREKRGQANKSEWARTVRLLVDSPRHAAAPKAKGKGNSFLNDLKRKVIKALETSELRRLVRAKGYGCDDSRLRTRDDQIRNSMTTTVFKVMLDNNSIKSTPKETIEAVHEDLCSSVRAVLKDFAKDLDKCFGEKVEGQAKPVKGIRRQTKPEGLSVRDNTLEQSSKKTRYETTVGMTPEELFEQCCSDIESAYARLGHKFGWRFLTCPRSAFVTHPKVALITLQPGGRRDYFPELPRESQERGSAYLIESWDGLPAGTAPLQQQVRGFFGALAQRIGAPSGDKLLTESLSSHFIPFRAPKIALLSNKRASLSFSESLWRKILQSIHPKVLVVIDQYAFEAFSRILQQSLRQSPNIIEMPIAWGEYKARIRNFSQGPTLCWFPHWSTFKIFSRRESQRAVGEIIDVLSKKLQ